MNNFDWDDDWVFLDSWFNFMYGDDDVVFVFFVEMLYFLVCFDELEVVVLFKGFNDVLICDGFELYVFDWVSGYVVYGWWCFEVFYGLVFELCLSEWLFIDFVVF